MLLGPVGTVLLHLLAAVLRRRALEGIGYGPSGEPNNKVVADGAVVSPSYSNATLQSSPLVTTKPLADPPKPAQPTATALHPSQPALQPPPIRAVYVLCPSPFTAVDTFTESSAKAYDLQLVRVAGSMRDALQAYLDTPGGAGVEAVLVGTRRNDPHGGESLA